MQSEVKVREEIKSRQEFVERKIVVEHQINNSLDSLDEGSKQLVKVLLELGILREQPKKTAEDVAVLQGLDQPYYLSIANARKLLSQDAAGKGSKENTYGNNYVVCLPSKDDPKVYFKCSHVGSHFIQEYFLTEQAVYQMSLLLGGGIIAPTRLLVIDIPGELRHTVQASLAIKGISLENILALPGLINMVKGLGKEKFEKEFSSLIDGNYYKNWLDKTKIDAKLEFEAQCLLLADKILALSSDKRPLDCQDKKLTRELLKNKIEATKGLKSTQNSVLETLAIISQYPENSLWF